MTETRAIDTIRVEGRHRTDIGSLSDLMESIRRVGLLHPVVVTEAGRLVAGQRRLGAVRQLGWSSVPVTVVTSLDDARALLMAERDENTCRKDMLPSEKVALGLALEELERPSADKRRREGNRRGGQVGENFSSTSEPVSRGERTGKVYDLVGETVGMSGPTYKRAKAVVAAAESGDPNGQEALKEMDRTGKVTPAYAKVSPTNRGERSPALNQSKAEKMRATHTAYTGPLEGRYLNLATAARGRVESVVGQCNAWERALHEINVELAARLATADEVDGWLESVRGARRQLVHLERRILESVKTKTKEKQHV